MAWWEYLIFGYVGLVLLFGVPFIVNGLRRPSCPRCAYPLYKCECRTEHVENVERSVR